MATGTAIGAKRRPALILRRGRANPNRMALPKVLPNRFACHLTPVASDTEGNARLKARAHTNA